MRVLIVEDDPHKLNKLSTEISKFSVLQDTKKVTSLQEAMAAVSSSTFDLVVLDMAIPSHTGGLGGIDVYSQPVGGLDILLYLSVNDIPAKVIIVTQYPTVEYNQQHIPLHDLKNELSRDSVENVVDVIFFSEDNDWKEPFNRALRREI